VTTTRFGDGLSENSAGVFHLRRARGNATVTWLDPWVIPSAADPQPVGPRPF